jgi:hypothetical protein
MGMVAQGLTASTKYVDCGSGSTLDDVMGTSFTLYWAGYFRDEGQENAGEMMVKDGVGYWEFQLAGSGAVYLAKDYATTDLIRRSGTGAVTTGYRVIIATGDGSSTAANYKLYVDGVEVSSYATTTNGSGSIVSDASLSLRISNAQYNADVDFFECAVWKGTVLNSTQIGVLSTNRGKYNPLLYPTNLSGYWTLDDFGNGQTMTGASTVKDRSGNANHGTPTNSPVSLSDTMFRYPNRTFLTF